VECGPPFPLMVVASLAVRMALDGRSSRAPMGVPDAGARIPRGNGSTARAAGSHGSAAGSVSCSRRDKRRLRGWFLAGTAIGPTIGTLLWVVAARGNPDERDWARIHLPVLIPGKGLVDADAADRLRRSSVPRRRPALAPSKKSQSNDVVACRRSGARCDWPELRRRPSQCPHDHDVVIRGSTARRK